MIFQYKPCLPLKASRYQISITFYYVASPVKKIDEQTRLHWKRGFYSTLFIIYLYSIEKWNNVKFLILYGFVTILKTSRDNIWNIREHPFNIYCIKHTSKKFVAIKWTILFWSYLIINNKFKILKVVLIQQFHEI